MVTANRVALAAVVLLVLVSPARSADEKASGAREVKVLMLGDSVTAYGMPEAVTGPLNDLTKGQVKWTLVNGGAGGDTASGGKARIGKLLAEHKPDVVTISFGLNEVSQHYKPETFKSNMLEIVRIINQQAPAARIILFTATPFDIVHHFNGKDKGYNAEGGADVVLDTKFNRVTRELAAEKQLPLIDLHRYFLTEPDFARKFIIPEFQKKPDGVHLVPEGYKFVGPYIAKALAGWYEAEIAREPKAVTLRDQTTARLKKVAAQVGEAKEPQTRRKLLAELDEIWQAVVWLPAEATIWSAVYYTGFHPQPVNPQPQDSASAAAPAKPGHP
jgi:lysophospholipase L1-like esterase